MFKQWNHITNNFYINVELISLIFASKDGKLPVYVIPVTANTNYSCTLYDIDNN